MHERHRSGGGVRYLSQLFWLERPRYAGPGAAGSVVLALLLVVILLTAVTEWRASFSIVSCIEMRWKP
jgi:hypothetical protein